jgi:hypothetical protein
MNQKSTNSDVSEDPKKETSRIEYISTDFNLNSFTDGNELKLLKELNMCDTTILDGQFGSCSPKYFRFFKLNDAVSLKNAFLLLINGAAFPNDPVNAEKTVLLLTMIW